MFKIRNHQKSNYKQYTNNNISSQTSIKIPKFNIIFYKTCQKTNRKNRIIINQATGKMPIILIPRPKYPIKKLMRKKEGKTINHHEYKRRLGTRKMLVISRPLKNLH